MASPRELFLKIMHENDLTEGIPVWEWAPWWNQTIDAWRSEKPHSLPEKVQNADLAAYFGLDPIRCFSIFPTLPAPATSGAPLVRTEADYEKILPFQRTEWPAITKHQLADWVAEQQTGNSIFWMVMHGPFGHTRRLLGIEPHLLAFCEKPALMKRMIRDLTDFTVKAINAVAKGFVPEFMTFFEDMSFNHGPMISKEIFQEFLAPFYRRVVPLLHRHNILCIYDSDGFIEPIIPWLEDLGIDGLLPLERMAGNDVCRIRRLHPLFKMIGGFDKMVMNQGEEAIRAEFNRIKPAVLAGGFVAGVDHQTPPGVSLENYKAYIRIYKEFSDQVAMEARWLKGHAGKPFTVRFKRKCLSQETPVRERFLKVMREGDASEGLPLIEWAGYWNLTTDNWKAEGLPDGMSIHQIHTHLGLDSQFQLWAWPLTGATPQPAHHGAPIIKNEKEYEQVLPTLYPDLRFDEKMMKERARRQADGTALLWITLDGFFWFPRRLMGIEPHMYAFFEQPELMKRIIEDVTQFNLRVIDKICQFYKPDFMTFAEDMSYNHGPMISRDLFEEFMAPSYRRIVPILKEHNILPMVDSDGDVEPLIPWLESVAIEGILPLERMAGVDVSRIRRNHPRWTMVGAFDKMIMHLGEGALRAEFERLKPAALSGRFIPSVDHQTPPAVSLEDYRLYIRFLQEFSDEVRQQARAEKAIRLKKEARESERAREKAAAKPSRPIAKSAKNNAAPKTKSARKGR